MNTYETESGYKVRETLEGIEVYEDGEIVCSIPNKTLESYRDEEENIDDDALEKDISDAIEVAEFIDYQKEYC